MIKVRVEVNGGVVGDVRELFEGFHNEDERNQHGERLFSEAGDVADESREIECHNNHKHQAHPQADPEAQPQIVQTVIAAKRDQPLKID